jgi:uncharacterized membrane protein YgdD (TMEM256/DUF423 family)
MPIWNRILAAIAGLMGAAGVALAALAAHRGGGETLTTAALFLILHAGPAFAAALASRHSATLAGASLLAAGALLFSTDLALLATLAAHPVPMAAPVGGTLMIAGWLTLCCAAIFIRSPRSGDRSAAGMVNEL